MIRDRQIIEDNFWPVFHANEELEYLVNNIEKYIEDERERAIRWAINQLSDGDKIHAGFTKEVIHKAKTELL